MRQHVLIGALICAGAGAQAAPLPLGEDELKTTVAGKTVSIDTPLGLPLSVNYGANGIMTGTAGTALAVYLGSAKDRGRWQIRNGKLCQKWFKWLSGETTCLAIQQDGLKIYWRSDEGKTGTATIEPGPPVIEGATASGLGLPPQPAEPQAEPTERAAVQPPHPQQPPHTQKSASVPVRREVVNVRPVVHSIAFAPAGPSRSAVAREAAPEQQPRSEISTLAEPSREVARPIEPPGEPSAARFAVAALMPMRPSASPPEPITVLPRETDPFDAEREPMRAAAETLTLGVMEHRWCLVNAFAKGPSRSSVIPTDVEPEFVSAPILLTIAQEQAYEGELPLHEPACITEAPAIGLLARVTGAEH